MLDPFKLEHEECHDCLQSMHLSTQSFPADDPPHGHVLFFTLGFLLVSELVESLSDINDMFGLGLFSREE